MDHIIRIEGLIGLAVTAESVRLQLQGAPQGARIVARINSDGGSVSEAVAIYNELHDWPGGVDTEVHGWALSSASLVLQAGRRRRVYPTSLVMVHAPWIDRGGNAAELRRNADVLEQVQQSMRGAYTARGIKASQLEAWFDGQDHWFTADEAAKAGLVDEIVTATQDAAALSRQAFASCRFPLPEHITERLITMTASSGAANGGNTPNADAIRAEAIRAEGERRAGVRAKFAMGLVGERATDPVLMALRQQCEDDPTCTPMAAGQKLLAALAADITPAAGAYYVREHVANGRDGERMAEFRAACTDALVMRAGLVEAEPHPAARTVKGLSVVAMAERILSMRGETTAGLSPAELIKAGLSTSDFPSLLSGTANKSLRVGYESAPATFRGWTGERELPNFKPGTLVMLSEAPSLLKVLEGAEYTFGKLDDSGSTFQIATFGRILNLTRQALINDDTSAFTALPAAWGASAVRLEADLVYAQLTGNPVLGDGVTLFHATHGNTTGTATLDLTNLGAARAAMRKQKGIQGLEFVDVQPRFLLVPVAMETAAEQLLASLVDPSKSNDTPNVEWVRGLQLVADPRLDADSATRWYLSASPRQVEGVIRAYLMGETRPYLEENDQFTIDAISYKARHDTAAGVVDYRALYRVG